MNQKQGKTLKHMITRMFSMTLAMGLCFSSSVAYAANDGTRDYSGRWSEKVIEKWADEGILGLDATLFKPTQAITHQEMNAMFSAMLNTETQLLTNPKTTRFDVAEALSQYLGVTSDGKVAFKDKDNFNQKQLQAVQALVNCGVLSGFPDGNFHGEAELTREQALVLIDRVHQYVNAYDVVAKTQVKDSGLMVNALSYNVQQSITEADMEQLHFDITFVIAPNPWLKETENKIQAAKITEITLKNGQLNVNFEPTSYSSLINVIVDCTNDRLDTVKGRFAVETPIVDDFEMSTYTSSEGITIKYWLYTPKNPEGSVPLMVWEHGGGEVLSSSFEGANLVANRGAVSWIENGYNTAVLSVQYPENYAFEITDNPEQFKMMKAYNLAKFELISQLIDKGVVDKQRVYISGASSGGGGALRFIMQYPDLFAGGLLMCTKDTLVPMSLRYDLAYKLENKADLRITQSEYDASYAAAISELKGNDIVDVPLWIVHAENDQVCTSYTSLMLYDALNELGAQKNHLSLYSDDEMEALGVHTIYHGVWTPTLHNLEIMDWLYSQSRA
ncbi:prolyl oligopeptidase family serine peptidase [Fusibacter ferrireducens]|uniref:S-layer homology domain-containing protein n=1 Tax=Fusibacter ferrireducens TaxID=2785058 RepID=A0ABR9ZR78_9FIRM|nr:S-layer homology domain-containing protein [Fusibacter ferrireducens]MBF4692149.1 S-layer homology domain-containing protein [Fusibacter ferrireducens]